MKSTNGLQNITYFLGHQTGEAIKIGRTTQKMSVRSNQHSGRGPSKVNNGYEFLAAVPGTPNDEKCVHGYFQAHLCPGEKEYFYPAEQLRGYIKWLRTQWFTLNTITDADDPLHRTCESVDGSMWLPNDARLTVDEPMTLLGLTSRTDGPWADILNVEPVITGDDYYTDGALIAAARVAMDGIDLDPATHPMANRKYIRAPTIYTLNTNGLQQRWHGKVWCNPPFNQWQEWAPKIVGEWDAGNVDAMCILLPTRSLTAKSVAQLLDACTAICFTKGRRKFWGPIAKDSPDDGHAIFYFGDNPRQFCGAFREIGSPMVSSRLI